MLQSIWGAITRITTAGGTIFHPFPSCQIHLWFSDVLQHWKWEANAYGFKRCIKSSAEITLWNHLSFLWKSLHECLFPNKIIPRLTGICAMLTLIWNILFLVASYLPCDRAVHLAHQIQMTALSIAWIPLHRQMFAKHQWFSHECVFSLSK